MNISSVLLLPLLLHVNEEYGFIGKKRYCKNKTWLSELMYFTHILLVTYTWLSPFILKDYFSNMLFITFMAISWFVEKMLTGTVNCYFTNLEDRTCGNENIRTGISPFYLVIAVSMVIYDAYKIFQLWV